MSATELMEQVKALPPRERKKFLQALHRLETSERSRKSSKARSAARPVPWPDLTRWRKEVFGDKVLPNMVLVEREESPY